MDISLLYVYTSHDNNFSILRIPLFLSKTYLFYPYISNISLFLQTFIQISLIIFNTYIYHLLTLHIHIMFSRSQNLCIFFNIFWKNILDLVFSLLFLFFALIFIFTPHIPYFLLSLFTIFSYFFLLIYSILSLFPLLLFPSIFPTSSHMFSLAYMPYNILFLDSSLLFTKHISDYLRILLTLIPNTYFYLHLLLLILSIFSLTFFILFFRNTFLTFFVFLISLICSIY